MVKGSMVKGHYDSISAYQEGCKKKIKIIPLTKHHKCARLIKNHKAMIGNSRGIVNFIESRGW
jgi:hypothetical protein